LVFCKCPFPDLAPQVSLIFENRVKISSTNRIARETNEINAIIAFRMLYSMANRIRCELGRERTKWSNRSNMIHSFRYRDISKEGIMALFEVLIEK
jgi:hypothetical protein